MIYYIFLAVLNGIVIGTTRAINGRLSVSLGPFSASLWNHIVGFVFITLLLIIGENIQVDVNMISDIPTFTYLGGVFGALFVAVNSYVFPRIGATKTVLLVMSGQMISSVIIDYKTGAILSTLTQFIGIFLILLGIYLSHTSRVIRDSNSV